MEPSARFFLQDVEPNSPGLKFAMPLVSVHGDEERCIGTGFLVRPGLAITAAHVVREWDDYQVQKDGYRKPGINFYVTAFQLFNGRILPWVVDEISSSWTADIAFLRFNKPAWWGDGANQVKTPCARLNLNPPSVGDQVRVFGFPNSSVENRILYVSPSECTARVREVAFQSRLQIRPTSYVELDGEIRAGMSGGPCFDQDWNVIGMCSKGWDFLKDVPDESPLSYSTALARNEHPNKSFQGRTVPGMGAI